MVVTSQRLLTDRRFHLGICDCLCPSLGVSAAASACLPAARAYAGTLAPGVAGPPAAWHRRPKGWLSPVSLLASRVPLSARCGCRFQQVARALVSSQRQTSGISARPALTRSEDSDCSAATCSLAGLRDDRRRKHVDDVRWCPSGVLRRNIAMQVRKCALRVRRQQRPWRQPCTCITLACFVAA